MSYIRAFLFFQILLLRRKLWSTAAFIPYIPVTCRHASYFWVQNKFPRQAAIWRLLCVYQCLTWIVSPFCWSQSAAERNAGVEENEQWARWNKWWVQNGWLERKTGKDAKQKTDRNRGNRVHLLWDLIPASSHCHSLSLHLSEVLSVKGLLKPGSLALPRCWKTQEVEEKAQRGVPMSWKWECKQTQMCYWEVSKSYYSVFPAILTFFLIQNY